MSCHFLLSGSKICSSFPFTIPLSESMISTVCVTLNCMRRNTRQFRWIKILSAILHFVISSCLCHIELYKAQHPPVQMDKKIKCDLVYVTLNCMRRNTRQFRWIKILVRTYIL